MTLRACLLRAVLSYVLVLGASAAFGGEAAAPSPKDAGESAQDAANAAGDGAANALAQAAVLKKASKNASSSGDSKALEALALQALAQSQKSQDSKEKNEDSAKKAKEDEGKKDDKKKLVKDEFPKMSTTTYEQELATDEEYSSNKGTDGKEVAAPMYSAPVWNNRFEDSKADQLVDLGAAQSLPIGRAAAPGSSTEQAPSGAQYVAGKVTNDSAAARTEPVTVAGVPLAGASSSNEPVQAALGLGGSLSYAPAAGGAAAARAGSSPSGDAPPVAAAATVTEAAKAGDEKRREGSGGSAGRSGGSAYGGSFGGSGAATAGTLSFGSGAAFGGDRAPASSGGSDSFSFDGASEPTKRDVNDANVFEYASLRFKVLAKRQGRVRTDRALATPGLKARAK